MKSQREKAGLPTGFGARLKLSREHRGISKNELAKALRTTRTRISLWESDSGEVDMQCTMLINLSAYLGVSVGWLLVGETTGQVIAVSEAAKKTRDSATEGPKSRRVVSRQSVNK